MSLHWYTAYPTGRFYYLKEHSERLATVVAKLYYMHNRWNISIKDEDRREELTKLCEDKLVEITTQRLEGHT